MVQYFQFWLKYTRLLGFCNNIAAKYNKPILCLKYIYIGSRHASEMRIE